MENSIDATIEKIKIQEQIKESRLKEKREFDVTVASLNRSIRDTKSKVNKLKQEILQMETVTDDLQYQISVEKNFKDALSKETEHLFTELNRLRTESEQKLASVWEQRARLIEATRNVTENCDIRSLLIKSTGIDIARNLNIQSKHYECVMLKKHALEIALKRRKEAINKRKKLLEKPVNDEEFIRIKEALRYSEQMIANLKNHQT